MNKPSDEHAFLNEVFNHILHISRGECLIEEDYLYNLEFEEEKMNILAGLKMLHEDIELYKKEYKQKLEAEYKLKILKKKNDELEQFNYMASHDLKEPIRNIKNFSDLILRNYDDHSEDKIQKYLRYINEATVRMFDLLNAILNYSTAGKTIRTEQIEIEKLLDDILFDLGSLIDKKNIKIQYVNLPRIIADKSAVRSIFQNLITNSIKFKEPSRSLDIKITHTESTQENIFCVSDNGIGIESSYLEQIFELLKRLHSRSEIEGTGVGLSICKKLVEMHGGRIWVESTFGTGSQFYFAIPKNHIV